MWTFYSSQVPFYIAQLWLGSAKIHLLNKFYLFSVKKKNEKEAGVFMTQQSWCEYFTSKPKMTKKSSFQVLWAPRTSFNLLCITNGFCVWSLIISVSFKPKCHDTNIPPVSRALITPCELRGMKGTSCGETSFSCC